MKHWTIGKQIAASFAILLGLLACLGGVAWHQNQTVGHQLLTLTKESLPGVKRADAVVYEALKYRLINYRHLFSTNAAEMAELDRQAQPQGQKIAEELAGCEALAASQDEKRLVENVGPFLKGYRGMGDQIDHQSRAAPSAPRAAGQALYAQARPGRLLRPEIELQNRRRGRPRLE